jgi:arginine-tRNA-protein transferase
MKVSPGHYREKSHCGYCGGDDSSRIYGFLAYELTVEEYQELVDRGFRRSGVFVYKPDLAKSCCPQYTIRLKAGEFRPGKEHRQGLNRFNSFVGGDDQTKKTKKKKGKNNEYSLLTAIHEAEGEHFEIRLESSEFSKEKYELFRHYQMHVHNETEDEVSEEQFQRFLCDNPFPKRHDGHLQGHVHQTYYHEGRLIGIGVLDILPHCLSSVYFIWHQDYARFGMGKVASMQEIGLALELNKPYYYMGYYIHSCPKMKYKAQYRPSYLLEPRFTECDDAGGRWQPIERFESKLDESTYVTLVDKPTPVYDDDLTTDSKLFASAMPGLLPPSELQNLDPEDFVTLVVDDDDDEIPINMHLIRPQFRKQVKMAQLELVAILGKDLARDARIKVG